MAKTKSFAEKMQKGNLPREDHVAYKVVRPKVSNKGNVRFETKIVKVPNDANENKALGI